jgi:hypothetical protein
MNVNVGVFQCRGQAGDVVIGVALAKQVGHANFPSDRIGAWQTHREPNMLLELRWATPIQRKVTGIMGTRRDLIDEKAVFDLE